MSNNPFLPEDNNNNNKNDNENQNEKNENNDISKILEEGNATNAIPPPAYNEIVKPEPTYPSYPPPPFQATEISNENYDYPTNVHMNSNNNRRGRRGACCCAGGSRRNKTCSCGWMIVLIIFIILGVLSIVNNNACNRLNLGTNPEKFSFDANANKIFQVNADNARVRNGEIRIFQKDFNGDSQTVDLEVYTATTGIIPKIETASAGGIFEMRISQSGFSIFNIPPRCMRSQINVYLPQQYGGTLAPSPNTIRVKHQDITMTGNDIPYQQNITLVTIDGDIHLNDVRAQNLNIQTEDGDISGTVASISSEFIILTKDGDLNLTMGNPQTPFTFTPKFTIVSNDGDILLNFQNSFSGNYSIQSNDGSIQIDNQKLQNPAVGAVNNGIGGNLNIITDDGDVDINFQAV